ncbi:unnamed protein product [Blepharisma stoltei]|uniref:Uncharacterized protein n=1 Tax=Blepharisma stoltei TaxID=1481888 RepID=A0AAU9ILK0_9CILI|nr:unnamed protein product [Blepharisma stoltei]
MINLNKKQIEPINQFCIPPLIIQFQYWPKYQNEMLISLKNCIRLKNNYNHAELDRNLWRRSKRSWYL